MLFIHIKTCFDKKANAEIGWPGYLGARIHFYHSSAPLMTILPQPLNKQLFFPLPTINLQIEESIQICRKQWNFKSSEQIGILWCWPNNRPMKIQESWCRPEFHFYVQWILIIINFDVPPNKDGAFQSSDYYCMYRLNLYCYIDSMGILILYFYSNNIIKTRSYYTYKNPEKSRRKIWLEND